MKKFMIGLLVISLTAFIIAWGVIGIKILNNEYDITVGTYFALACMITMLISIIYLRFSNKCPHCKKLRIAFGEYCPYCGNKIRP